MVVRYQFFRKEIKNPKSHVTLFLSRVGCGSFFHRQLHRRKNHSQAIRKLCVIHKSSIKWVSRLTAIDWYILVQIYSSESPLNLMMHSFRSISTFCFGNVTTKEKVLQVLYNLFEQISRSGWYDTMAYEPFAELFIRNESLDSWMCSACHRKLTSSSLHDEVITIF